MFQELIKSDKRLLKIYWRIRKMKKNIFYWHRGLQKTFLNTIKIFLEDIKKLEEERKEFLEKYYQKPNFENLALFYAGAKHIEQMLILGICGEYLIKSILFKYNFIINSTKRSIKFSEEFISKLNDINNSGLKTTYNQIMELDNLSQKNLIASLDKKTIRFEDCIFIFNKEITKQDYFEDNPSYQIFSEYAQDFYGYRIDYKNAFEILRNIRNNYGHVPESQDEEQGIMPFLYDFLVFVCKKEFPTFFNNLEKFKEYIKNETLH